MFLILKLNRIKSRQISFLMSLLSLQHLADDYTSFDFEQLPSKLVKEPGSLLVINPSTSFMIYHLKRVLKEFPELPDCWELVDCFAFTPRSEITVQTGFRSGDCGGQVMWLSHLSCSRKTTKQKTWYIFDPGETDLWFEPGSLRWW